MSNFSSNSVHCLTCAKSSSHDPQLLAGINGRTVRAIASLNNHSTLPNMDNTSEGNTGEEKTIREQILFDFEDCVKEFEKLR